MSRLRWHIGDNLRWLSDNPGAPRVPCGHLTGLFLREAADRLDALAAAAREGGDVKQAPGETPQSGAESATPNPNPEGL